jgi:hypothetical protein
MEQRTLPLIDPECAGSIEERFEAFHQTNPWVYQALATLARRMLARGHTKLGIGMCWEVLRWEYMIETDDPTSGFRLNDHFRSRYSRLIQSQERDLDGIFETRGLRAP